MITPRVRLVSAGTLAALSLAALVQAAPPAPARPAGRTAPPDSNQVLARVGREAITRGDVNRRMEEIPEQLRANYNTPEGRQQILDRVIEEKVWMQLATKKGVPSRPEVQRQLEQARRDLVIRTYLNEVMAGNPAPSDSEARAYYDQHADQFKVPATVSLRHIQSRTQAEARRILTLARGTEDFGKLARQYSTDTLTRNMGGALGSITRDGVFGALGSQPALAESAFRIPVGKVGGPFKTDHGWHVIRVDNKTEDTVRPLDQVRSMILRQISSQKAQDYYRKRLDQAKHEIGVTSDSGAIRSFVSARKSARDMFKEAQDAGAPADRIEKYRKLLAEYPDSDVSPQAQFMIGFIYSEELKNYDEADKAFRLVLSRYPKSELAPSAQWMVDHMRTEDAPAFLNLEADSSKGAAVPAAKKGSSGKK
jgi:peptidyl-prolyl cis-trans isomerase C